MKTRIKKILASKPVDSLVGYLILLMIIGAGSMMLYIVVDVLQRLNVLPIGG